MIALVQRVAWASVTVDDAEISRIGAGLLILLGVHAEDTDADSDLLARKCLGLRIFQDSDGKMNRSVVDVDGDIMVVSQFTLLGDVRRGMRPYFGEAAPPEQAHDYYESFMRELAKSGLSVAGGVFGASMQVELLNDGPVTISIDTRDFQ